MNDAKDKFLGQLRNIGEPLFTKTEISAAELGWIDGWEAGMEEAAKIAEERGKVWTAKSIRERMKER